eukprot:scaffold38730_cov35-Cyclotella_meneghiniana.AAC.1
MASARPSSPYLDKENTRSVGSTPIVPTKTNAARASLSPINGTGYEPKSKADHSTPQTPTTATLSDRNANVIGYEPKSNGTASQQKADSLNRVSVGVDPTATAWSKDSGVPEPHNGGGASDHQDKFERWQEGRFILNHSMGHEGTSQKIFRFSKKKSKAAEATVKCDINCGDNLIVFFSKLVSGAKSTGEIEEIFHQTLGGNRWSFTGEHLLMSQNGLVHLDPSAVVGMKVKVNELNSGVESLKLDFSQFADPDSVKHQLIQSNKHLLTAKSASKDELDFFEDLLMMGLILFFVTAPKAEDWVGCWRRLVQEKKIFVNLYHERNGRSAKVDTGSTQFRGRTMSIMTSEPIFVQWFADIACVLRGGYITDVWMVHYHHKTCN